MCHAHPKLPACLLIVSHVQRSMRRFGTNGSGMRVLYSRYTRSDVFFREGQGFILVYSIASRATFDRLDVFRQAMLKVKRQKPVFMLVGNKCDKQYEREVSREEGAALARQFGCQFLETSAKTAHNVEQLFMNLVRLLRSTKQQEQGVPGPIVRSPEKEKKRKCITL